MFGIIYFNTSLICSQVKTPDNQVFTTTEAKIDNQ